MKVIILFAESYNYTNKDGIHKEGMGIDVCRLEPLQESDGKGNFKFGQPTEKIFIPRSSRFEPNDLINLVGKEVDLKYEREVGKRFETLVDIEVLK